MEPYMETLRQVPLLREDEEQALARQFKATGDPAARARLITANLRHRSACGHSPACLPRARATQ